MYRESRLVIVKHYVELLVQMSFLRSPEHKSFYKRIAGFMYHNTVCRHCCVDSKLAQKLRYRFLLTCKKPVLSTKIYAREGILNILEINPIFALNHHFANSF